MTFFECTADLVGQLTGNGQKGMLQIDALTPCRKFLATPLYITCLRVTLTWSTGRSRHGRVEVVSVAASIAAAARPAATERRRPTAVAALAAAWRPPPPSVRLRRRRSNWIRPSRGEPALRRLATCRTQQHHNGLPSQFKKNNNSS